MLGQLGLWGGFLESFERFVWNRIALGGRPRLIELRRCRGHGLWLGGVPILTADTLSSQRPHGGSRRRTSASGSTTLFADATCDLLGHLHLLSSMLPHFGFSPDGSF